MAHDVGGHATNDPIPRAQHAFMPWEMRADALMWILTDATRADGPRMTVDELRRGIESMAPEDYRDLGYYEKWLLSMIHILEERGVVDAAALERRAHEIAHERGHAHP
jgi:hypothetical protein